ncbi:MAG TPA: tetratricopeptide repeat protein [Candidatus Binataceae bacterium]|nr:tetratricopeptide repeat protein [Candidatus Binataceae bacterium]
MGLPPGHPAVAMPRNHPALSDRAQIGAVVLQAEKQAERHPDDVTVWNRYGDLALHFATFNPADYEKARHAFAHVLTRDPANRQALRGLGDVDFDTRHYPSAIEAYQRYLREQPDDSSVLTDLGTSYLSQHNCVQAIKEYRAALIHSSDFFPARFNLAVAYLLQKDNANARDALIKARAVAPDESARTRIDEILAQVDQNAAGMHPHRAETRTQESNQ